MALRAKDRSLASAAESTSVEVQNVSTLASPDESSSFFSAESETGEPSPSSNSNNDGQQQRNPLPPSPIQMQESVTQQGRMRPQQSTISPQIFPLSSTPHSQTSSMLLEQALFTSYTSTGSVLPDADEESLPSLPVGGPQSLLVVPSPVSRPPPSFLMEDSTTPRTQQLDHRQLPQQTSDKSAEAHSESAPRAKIGKSRQPPVPEVLLDNEEDTFFEDRSLGKRAQRSLVSTPRNKRDISDSLSSSLQPSPTRYKSQQEASKNDREVSYTSVNSSPFRGNSLQTLIRMKEELARANEKLKTMEQRNRILVGERDDLGNKLKEQDEVSRNQVMQLKVELSRLQGMSETMQSQRHDWSSEKKRLEEQIRGAAREKKELMHKRLASENRQKELKVQIDRLQAQLDSTNLEKSHLLDDCSRLKQENSALERSKTELEEKLDTLATQETQSGQLQAEKEEWVKEKESLQRELEQLGNILEEVKKQNDAGQSSHQQERERLESELQDANDKLQQSNETSRQEIEKLQSEIRGCNETIQHLRSRSSMRSPNSMAGNTVRFQSETASAPSESSPLYQNTNQAFEPSAISERLARIRDSSERASLIRSHNREVARLKEEKESAIKSLEASHADAIRRARKHADLKLESRLHELKTSLQQEYDEKLEEVESSYRRQIAELKEEATRDKDLSESSLRSAMSKLAEIIQQHERETARRHALERSNKHMADKFEADKKNISKRHVEEIQMRRREWEEERNALLSALSEECTSLFASKRSSIARQRSPRSDANREVKTGQGLVIDTSRKDDSEDGEDETAFQQLRIDSSRSAGSNAPVISPTFSDIDSVLRETEQLIEGLF